MKITANKAAENLINAGLEQLEKLNFTQKLYKRDGTLWKQDAESLSFINSFLGWTEIYDWTLGQLPEVKAFASEVKEIFDHVVLMGMGGSSLAPEVLRVLFGKQAGWPELLVLDSTNPEWVAAVRSKINPAKTLFIFASKSGGTVEPASHFAYFYDEVSKISPNPGANFTAVTDPGTGLEALAREKKFRKVFLNPADIGGRFSALSLFGAVPSALCGLDIEAILKIARKEGIVFKTDKQSAAARLGAFMGQGFLEGKDKLTLLMPSNIDTFGLWIEQLVAESTGKEEKGIVPVAGEALRKEFVYNNDRVFAYISCPGANNSEVETAAGALKDAGYPVVEIEMEDLGDIGVQFLLWEVATAAAGALMRINPFDQPNVQLAKTMAKNILADLEAGKKPADAAAELLLSSALEGKVKFETLGQDLYKLVKENDYIALLPYVNETKETAALFAELRAKLSERTKSATMFGYGPRYLHSTGQLHKGDGKRGVFIIISAESVADVRIPGASYGFEDLVQAQALGDFKALNEKGRRAVKLHFKKPVLEALRNLSSKF
jgi:glucose-6-phosphate isomerase